jgi:hypothetical protein
MAVIDKYSNIADSFRAAASIKSLAATLRNWQGPIPFPTLQTHLDSMRGNYAASISLLLGLGTAAQINPQITTFYTGSLPANPYVAFQDLGTALTAFYTAYVPVFATLTPISFTVANGHTYNDIPLSQLATLTGALDAVISAAAALS